MSTPLPPGEIWVQFPLLAVVVLCLALAGGAIFIFTKWIWGEYKKIKAEDLAWREKQNLAREAAVAEQNRLWREAMSERDARYEKYDRERQDTLEKVAKSMATLSSQLKDHDDQAKGIKQIVERIDVNTQPIKSGKGKIQ